MIGDKESLTDAYGCLEAYSGSAICMFSEIGADGKARNCNVYLFIYDLAVYDDSYLAVDFLCEGSYCCQRARRLS